MDLSNFKSKTNTITIELMVNDEPLIDDEGKPFTWTFYHPHSKEYKDLLNEQNDKRLARMRKNKNGQLDYKAADIEKDAKELLVKATTDFYVIEGGKVLGVSKDNTTRLLEDYPFIRTQVLDEMDAYANFTKV